MSAEKMFETSVVARNTRNTPVIRSSKSDYPARSWRGRRFVSVAQVSGEIPQRCEKPWLPIGIGPRAEEAKEQVGLYFQQTFVPLPGHSFMLTTGLDSPMLEYMEPYSRSRTISSKLGTFGNNFASFLLIL